MADYYIDSAGSNTAPYDTWAKAATDPQTVLDLAPAGSNIYARGTITQAATLDIDTNSGTGAAPISFIGCNAAGVDDGTRFILDGNSTAVNNILMTTRSYVYFKNIEGINATGSSFDVSGNQNYCYQHNCEWSNSGLHGFYGHNTYRYCSLTEIRCNSNASTGMHRPGGNYDIGIRVVELMLNGDYGLVSNSDFSGSDILTHNNGLIGAYTVIGTIAHSTFDTETIGLQFDNFNTSSDLNLFTNCTTGIKNSSNQLIMSYRNAFYNNGTDIENVGTGSAIEIGKVTLTEDPYVDRANDNFTRKTNDAGVGIAVGMGGNEATTTAYLTAGNPSAYSSGGGGVGRQQRLRIHGA